MRNVWPPSLAAFGFEPLDRVTRVRPLHRVLNVPNGTQRHLHPDPVRPSPSVPGVPPSISAQSCTAPSVYPELSSLT
jgi:hypothetical protein